MAPTKSVGVLGAVSDYWADAALMPPLAQAVQSINKNPVPQTNLGSVIENEAYRFKLVAMRLRLLDGERMPFQFFGTALGGDKVFVFVVQDNEAITLEDSTVMFPSDQLITQLRLLQK